MSGTESGDQASYLVCPEHPMLTLHEGCSVTPFAEGNPQVQTGRAPFRGHSQEAQQGGQGHVCQPGP